MSFNPSGYSKADLTVGIEVEYPKPAGPGKALTHRGDKTMSLQRGIDPSDFRISGQPEYDGTVGLEVVSDRLDAHDAHKWYRDVLDYVEAEYGVPYAPVGLVGSSNTAGTHIHMSPLERDEARRLFEFCEEPWMRVFVCTSVVQDEAPFYRVFRDDYCHMRFNTERYDAVNQRGSTHYEWRLPEPMLPDHFELVMEFLRIFKASPSQAKEFAQKAIEESDVITSIVRAEEIGQDIMQLGNVSREPYPATEDFFVKVYQGSDMPYIYLVEIEGTPYYAFRTSLDESFRAAGVSFNEESILRADTLDEVNNPTIRKIVNKSIDQRNKRIDNKEETEYLKEVIAKKKE